jgi:hypothetical protein
VTKHILLLEPKPNEAEQLAAQIEAAGAYAVTRVQNMREACASLAAQAQDLALIPITRNDSLVYSLRMLQPGLPLYLLQTAAQEFIPERQLQAVQGVVRRPLVIPALPHLLDGTWTAELSAAHGRTLDKARLQQVLAQLAREERVRVALVVAGASPAAEDEPKIVAHYSPTAEAYETAVLARMAPHAWDARPGCYQLAFLNKLDGPENLLLRSHPLGGDQRLILGGELHISLTHLRRVARRVAAQIHDPTAELVLPTAVPNQYAIVWRGRQPVAEGLCTILHNVLSKIGQLYHCPIHHLEVRPTYTHLVLTVPPQRSSGWIAETFKRQSEKLLARTLHVTLPFWADGYLARESAVPLSEAELKLFGSRGGE